ncbi:hypothetical protein SAMN06297144_2491 [Sphingomonas guangdongensis]|uniref:Uncharacterized protein n=1 Tax=Sphingomonas guangdongensis TaxID=1141890 RepID=A0A285QZT6_9SPHN|nr:hypothetical protein [Sphingomonas guangdongensis]SOB87361.1 hypothetical protein SAMN06297144_2491 [Sphingomonas guangdongensis]
MRPRSIVLFERLYLGAWALGLINTGLNWSQTMRQFSAGGAVAVSPVLLYASTAIGLLIPLVLWFFITRRASLVAKWVLVVLFAIGLGSIALATLDGRLPSGLAGIVAVTATVLQAVAIGCLFQPDAREWFGEEAAEVKS